MVLKMERVHYSITFILSYLSIIIIVSSLCIVRTESVKVSHSRPQRNSNTDHHKHDLRHKTGVADNLKESARWNEVQVHIPSVSGGGNKVGKNGKGGGGDDDLLKRILDAGAVFGLGILTIKEISSALGGSLVLAPFILVPLVILSAMILLVPELKELGGGGGSYGGGGGIGGGGGGGGWGY